MLAKLILAVTTTVLAAGVLAVGHQEIRQPVLGSVAPSSAPKASPWGFELSFALSASGRSWCGTCEYRRNHTSWLDGPRDGFDRRNPRELARDSLAWVERTVKDGERRGREWLKLELSYPSGQRVVHVVHTNGTDISWDKQLAAWFENLPPTAEGGWPGESEPADLEWTLNFETGNVQGWNESRPESLEDVRELARSLETAPSFGAVIVKLAYPSGPLGVELERAIDLKQAPPRAWPQPLAAWLERLPPTLEAAQSEWAEETSVETAQPAGAKKISYRWTLTFAELGEIRGGSDNASEALEAMIGTAASLDGLPGIGLVTYELGRSERVEKSDRVETALYLVETTEVSELDELPRKLAEKAWPFCSGTQYLKTR